MTMKSILQEIDDIFIELYLIYRQLVELEKKTETLQSQLLELEAKILKGGVKE